MAVGGQHKQTGLQIIYFWKKKLKYCLDLDSNHKDIIKFCPETMRAKGTKNHLAPWSFEDEMTKF